MFNLRNFLRRVAWGRTIIIFVIIGIFYLYFTQKKFFIGAGRTFRDVCQRIALFFQNLDFSFNLTCHNHPHSETFEIILLLILLWAFAILILAIKVIKRKS